MIGRVFNVGDRVLHKDHGYGTVKIAGSTMPGVVFDNEMGGHDLHGLCSDGYGWFCVSSMIELIEETVAPAPIDIKFTFDDLVEGQEATV